MNNWPTDEDIRVERLHMTQYVGYAALGGFAFFAIAGFFGAFAAILALVVEATLVFAAIAQLLRYQRMKTLIDVRDILEYQRDLAAYQQEMD
jgi:hypothetical protein